MKCLLSWISVTVAQVPEAMVTNLNDMYFQGTQAYYDVSDNLSRTAFSTVAQAKHVEAAPIIEKSLVNWKMRQSIESSCQLKCEMPNVVATRFPVEDFNFDDDVEGKYMVHLLERATCLKNCNAGFTRLSTNKCK